MIAKLFYCGAYIVRVYAPNGKEVRVIRFRSRSLAIEYMDNLN